MIKLIGETPDTISKLLIVGHNPGLHQLCLKLAKTGDEKLFDKLTLKFPTCAFAAISFGKTSWQNIASAHGELTEFLTPKSIES